MKLLTSILFCVFISLVVHSQKMKFGLGLGANVSLIQASSELSMQNKPSYQPLIGTEIGLATAIDLSDHLILLGGFQYLMLRSKSNSGVTLRDGLSVDLTDNFRYKKQLVNSLLVEINFAYKLNPSFYLGTGANFAILLSANTKYYISTGDLKVPMHYLNPIRFYIPIFIGFTRDRYMVSLGYRQGIGNRLKDQNNLIRENEGHFFIDLKFFFGQKL